MKKLTVADIPHLDCSIDTMPNLMASLGKAKSDKIRYLDRADTSPLYKSQNIPNTVQELMQGKEPNAAGCWVDDIIQGIARLDHHSNSKGGSEPLSVTRLYNILQCVELINTRELMALMAIEKRQAQKYLKAVKLIMFHIERHLAITSSNQAE